jgi:hypothetical protein
MDVGINTYKDGIGDHCLRDVEIIRDEKG